MGLQIEGNGPDTETKKVIEMGLKEKIMYWDDERNIGNSLIVTLNYGWHFGTGEALAGDAEHVRGFDTVKDAEQAVREVSPCNCIECQKEVK